MKTIIITGASRGIGKSLAQRFLKNDDFVIGTSTKGTSDQQNKNFIMFKLDLSKPESIMECTGKIAELNRKIDILINNAGIAIEEEVNEPRIVPEYLRKILEVNVIGVTDFTERIIPIMNKNGHIVNISSRAGSLGHTKYTLNYPAYRISKAALNMVTRILAVRLAENITVSSVHPGWVKTDMGGEKADMEPAEVADDIFKLANSKVETGQFWFKGKKFPW